MENQGPHVNTTVSENLHADSPDGAFRVLQSMLESVSSHPGVSRLDCIRIFIVEQFQVSVMERGQSIRHDLGR